MSSSNNSDHVCGDPNSNSGEEGGTNFNDGSKKSVSPELSVPISPTSNGSTKSHKIEGKNKKSLHHKHQQQVNLNNQRANQQQTQSSAVTALQQSSSSSSANRRGHQKNPSGSTKVSVDTPANGVSDVSTNVCSTLNAFSKRAQELKADINASLIKQAAHQNTDQPIEVVKLKNDILKLSGLEALAEDGYNETFGQEQPDNKVLSGTSSNSKDPQLSDLLEEPKGSESNDNQESVNTETPENSSVDQPECNSKNVDKNESQKIDNTVDVSNQEAVSDKSVSKQKEPCDLLGDTTSGANPIGYRSDSNFTQALNKLTLTEEPDVVRKSPPKQNKSSPKKQNALATNNEPTYPSKDDKSLNDMISNEFKPMGAKLDANSKFIALKSSLQAQFKDSPHMLEPICRKLIGMSEENTKLLMSCEKYESENKKLTLVKQKLENLCRELQKSNNAIRIESLDLIKVEQGKAKEQTTKIQSTLSGVIKLFDENQQRNMSLRQENQELQMKLKSLLDHCDNWEKSVEAALRQRDIENRLLKTELAKANLLNNEEKEKFLGEKQELLQILSLMQEQQHRIEGQEAKLRSDLSSYASKYDECQAVISKGMNRFQTESKKMLKQIEKSKQDYKVLLTKYESSNKKMCQLLEEKQYWDRAMTLANKKVEALEKLCRALRERKAESKNDNTNQKSNGKGKNNKSIVDISESKNSIDSANIKTQDMKSISPVETQDSPTGGIQNEPANEEAMLKNATDNGKKIEVEVVNQIEQETIQNVDGNKDIATNDNFVESQN